MLGRLRGLTLRELASLASPVFIAIPLYVPVTAMLVFSYRVVSPWSVALFLFPALVAQKLFLLYQEQRQTSRELASAMASKERANLSFAAALVATLDARDRYTAGHSAPSRPMRETSLTDSGFRLTSNNSLTLLGSCMTLERLGFRPDSSRR